MTLALERRLDDLLRRLQTEQISYQGGKGVSDLGMMLSSLKRLSPKLRNDPAGSIRFKQAMDMAKAVRREPGISDDLREVLLTFLGDYGCSTE